MELIAGWQAIACTKNCIGKYQDIKTFRNISLA